MNVDTQEFLYMRGQLTGLIAAVADLEERQAELADEQASTSEATNDLLPDIRSVLWSLEARFGSRWRRPRPDLRVLEGGGRSGDHRDRPRLTVVHREAQ